MGKETGDYKKYDEKWWKKGYGVYGDAGAQSCSRLITQFKLIMIENTNVSKIY